MTDGQMPDGADEGCAGDSPGVITLSRYQKHHYADHIRSGSMCEGARSATVMFCMAVTLNRIRQRDPQSAQALCEA